MEQNNWYFPSLRGGERKGSTVGDKEIFKKFPYVSLAREILQNSIDVREHDDEPARVEFKSFKLKVKDIPQIDELKAQLKRCIDFWNSQEEIVEKYTEMLGYLNQTNIECLRISDFNTSGLTGLYSNDEKNNKFKALVKSTGVSIKGSSNAGGSKGVGKNAAIILSKNLFVWYTTMTSDHETGSIGIVDIVSGFDKNHLDDRNYFTQGKGFYSADANTNPIKELINFDKGFTRDEPGTDIYIINFRNNDGWDKEVIESIINSFCVAIYKNQIEVKVENTLINKENLYNLITDRSIMSNQKFYNSAMSNYMILSNANSNVKTYDIDTPIGSASLYVLPLDKNNDDFITHECEMVRYPYMKIKSQCKFQYLDFSALCIIEQNELGKFLRKIENPEHNSWDANRLEEKVEIARAKGLLNDIDSQINAFIEDAMQINNDDEIDPSKAGEFLQSVDDTGTHIGKGDEIVEGDKNHKSTTGILKKAKSVSLNASVPSSEGDGVMPVIGDIDTESGDDVVYPEGDNGGNGGDPRPGENEGGLKDGDLITLQKSDRTQVKYKLIAISPSKGIYKITFISPANKDRCYLSINMLGDSASQKKKVELKSLIVDGNPIEIVDGEYGPFRIKEGQKCIIKIETSNVKGNFSSEVIIYANK